MVGEEFQFCLGKIVFWVVFFYILRSVNTQWPMQNYIIKDRQQILCSLILEC